MVERVDPFPGPLLLAPSAFLYGCPSQAQSLCLPGLPAQGRNSMSCMPGTCQKMQQHADIGHGVE